jgi:uncharacterized protein (DUF1800 family)
MRPNRRSVLLGGAGLFAGAMLPSIALPPAFAAENNKDRAFLRRALTRLSFGPTTGMIDAAAERGFPDWLDRQLAISSDDEATKAVLAEAYLPIAYEAGKDEEGRKWTGLDEPKRPLRWLDAEPAALVPLNDWSKAMDYSERERPAREIQLATLIRQVHAEGQLREVIVQFWHDHFNVNSTKDAGCAAYFPLYDRAIRAHALGNFRALLGETAKAPSMLNYLNNAESRASPANENYGRELLELHTLGEGNYLNDRHKTWKDVPGASGGLAVGYIDQDVYEAARAFTGWTIGDGREIGDNETAPATGAFHYVDRWHDPYQKRILGREFAPNAAPMQDGETLLDMLAGHPGTALFIVEKLVRRLFADDPPESLGSRAAEAFLAARDAPDQIAQIVRLIALSDEFRDAPAAKMKRPIEFYAGLCRAFDARILTSGNAFDLLARAGWNQHEWRPPTGHPDHSSHWANTNTLSTLASLAINAFEDWFATSRQTLPGVNRDEIGTAGKLAEAVSAAFFGDGVDGAFVTALASTIGAPDDPLDEDEGSRLWQARTMIALAALTPEFMLR